MFFGFHIARLETTNVGNNLKSLTDVLKSTINFGPYYGSRIYGLAFIIGNRDIEFSRAAMYV